MLAALKVVAVFGAMFLSKTLAQIPGLDCGPQQVYEIDVGQCGSALKKFQQTSDGAINPGTHAASQSCGNCQVTLTATEDSSQVITIYSDAQNAIQNIFDHCISTKGYGTAQSGTTAKVTISHATAVTCA